jgi:EAL and modified HD-GYP domain-containing signal transduction protein
MGWLRRWLGREDGTGQAADASPPPAAGKPAAGPAAADGGAAAPPPVAFGQRRTLVGRSGQVGGFELVLPAALERRVQALDRAGDLPPQVANFLALLAAARVLQEGGRAVLVSVPAPVLARPGMAGQVAPGTLLMPLGPPLDDAVSAALRGRGVLLGRPDGPPAPTLAADFVLLRADAGGIDTLQLSALRWRKAQPDIRLVVVGLTDIGDVERMLAAGAWLAGGRLGGAPGPATAARPLQAAAHRVCALLSDLAQDREIRAVADAVRADAALSYRLLRYANSAALGLTRSVETVEDAVALLGRNELVRWLQVMLMTVAGGRQASAAVQEDALARGRLLEALAVRRGVDTPSVLFTVGLLSRLDTLLEQPLDAALASLRLSDEVRQALLQRQGPWAWYLALADALEGDDEERLARLAAPFGGLEAVLAEAETAWRWAAAVSAGQRQG